MLLPGYVAALGRTNSTTSGHTSHITRHTSHVTLSHTHLLKADSSLRQLLLSTHPRPLVSVKSDAYWGTGRNGQGLNRLGSLLMELR